MRVKLLYLVTEDWYFWSHRLPIARAARDDGYEVVVATHVQDHGERIRDEGFRLIPLRLSRETHPPPEEARALFEVRQLYGREQPDIAHQVALKPVMYGAIGLSGNAKIQVVNAFAGLGYLVASSSWRAKVMRAGVWNAFRVFLNRPNFHLLFQNQEDQALMTAKLKLPYDRTTVIRGSGVDVQRFHPDPEPSGTPIIVLPSRMLWIKGIEEFVGAAKIARGKGVDARFVLVGDTDPDNFSCIPREKLLEWQSSGVVEWWGHRQDMQKALTQANIVCLPSRGGEGVPKALLEAAACGRAIVATDVPGCRDIVREGVSGLLVPARNPSALAEAIQKLLNNPETRAKMALHCREIAVNEFSQEVVAQQTLALYQRLLKSARSSAIPRQ